MKNFKKLLSVGLVSLSLASIIGISTYAHPYCPVVCNGGKHQLHPRFSEASTVYIIETGEKMNGSKYVCDGCSQDFIVDRINNRIFEGNLNNYYVGSGRYEVPQNRISSLDNSECYYVFHKTRALEKLSN